MNNLRDRETVLKCRSVPKVQIVLGTEYLPTTRRYEIIVEVLRRFPEEALQKLEAREFEWLIPPTGLGACVEHFQHPFVYLGTELETWDEPVVIAIVAHELAHVALDHKLKKLTSPERHRQEDEAWAFVQECGFAEECERWKTFSPVPNSDPTQGERTG